MAQDRPSASNALETVRAFLETLLPTLEGEARFHTRVSIHLLGIVSRELQEGPALDRREQGALEALLGHGGELDTLNRELAERIRSGDLDLGDDEVFAHVLRSVEDKLRIVNPGRLPNPDP